MGKNLNWGHTLSGSQNYGSTLRGLVISRSLGILLSEPKRPSEVLTDPFWDGAIFGSSGVSKKSGKHTTIKTPFPGAIWAFDDIPGVSAGGAARLGVEYALKQAGRKHYSPKVWLNRHYKGVIGTPLFCLPGGFEGEGFYLDIQSCFWEIYRKMPLAFEFVGDRLKWRTDLTHEQALPTGWGDNKLVRNSLPGLWRAGRIQRIRGGKLESQELKYTPFRSIDHWLVLREMLDYIAWNAVHTFKAYYWHTDGGIWVEPFLHGGWQFCDWLYEQFGLYARLKDEGRVACAGVGRYIFSDVDRLSASPAYPGVDSIVSRDRPPVWLVFR